MTSPVKKAFFFLIVFTPLAFGTVEPWSIAVMEVVTALALVLFLWDARKSAREIVTVPGFVPFLFFLLFILLQLLPLPQALVRIISFSSWEIHQISSALSGKIPPFMTLSVHPKAGLVAFFSWTACFLFYILTVQLLTDKTMLKKTVVVVAVFGALLSFSSILQFYLTKDMALWFRHVPDNSMIVGPYICHNHYAGLMEMIFPVVLGLFFFYRPRAGNVSPLKGMIEIVSQEKANIHIIIGTAALLIATSVFVSLSRGGMISLTLSLVFFCWMLFKRRISRGNTFLVIALVLVTTMSVSWFGWEQIFQRFEQLKNAHGVIHNSRLDFWKDSANIIKDFPVTGSGAGTFMDIYPSHQTISGDITLSHAHNDYIELAAEGGIIALLLAAGFAGVVFFKTRRVFLARRDAYAVYIYMGAATGLLSILFHSFVDFNLQIHGNRLWFFFMAGLAVSAANTGLRKTSKKTRLLPVQSRRVNAVSLPLVAVLLGVILVFNFSNLAGKFYFSNIKQYTMDGETDVTTLETIRDVAGYAAAFDPLESKYFNAIANASQFLNEDRAAKENITKAVQLNPLNSGFLKRAGMMMIRRENSDAAGTLLQASVKNDISSSENRLQYGAWLISQNRTDRGLEMIKQAVVLDTKMMDRALTNLAVLGVDPERAKEAVPQLPGPVIAYAGFLYSYGKREAAEQTYLSALDAIEGEEKINKWQYYRIYRFFMKRKKQKIALKVMQRAADALPFDPGIRITIGDLYKRSGVNYRAKQAYEQALYIDADNAKAKKRLKALEKL